MTASPNSPISKDPLARLAEQQNWIPVEAETSLQELVKSTVTSLGGDTLRRALHGDWLHEPLHAVLTDIPVGAWSATVAFDAVGALTGSSSLDSAADATLVLGLLGAVGASITGLNDWSEIRKPAPRRIGLAHAALNVLGSTLFLASGIARMRKARPAARSLSALGILLISASAHLGGSLVYEHGVGVAAQPSAAEVTEDLQT